MSQNPIDAFSKELSSELLSPFGKVERSFEALGESISQVKTMAYPQVSSHAKLITYLPPTSCNMFSTAETSEFQSL